MAFTDYDFKKVEKTQNARQQQQQQKKEETENKKLDNIVIEPKPFTECKSLELITLTDLTVEIKSMFKGIFVDCEGALMGVDSSNGEINLRLYFKDCGKEPEEGSFRAIVPIENKGTTAVERLRGLNRMMNSSRCYELTDDAKDIFNLFMNKNKNGQIDCHVNEMPNNRNGIQYITVMVTGFNIVKIIKKLRGNKNEKGHYVDYQLLVERPIGIPTGTSDQNYLLTIERIDKAVFNRFSEEKLGMFMKDNGSIPMIR